MNLTKERPMPRTRLAILVAAGFLAALPAPAAVLRVGAGAGCNAATLSVAILGALFNGTESDSIYLTTTETLTAPVTIDLQLMGSLEIVGGFANCTDPLPQAGVRTTIQTTHSDGFVVQGGTSASRSFTLTQIRWQASDFQGRPLSFSQRVLATLEGSVLDNGYSVGDGGNVAMSGPDVILVLDGGTSVTNGVSAGNGGGIACSGGGTIGLLDGNVAENNATGNGGGIYLDGCTLNSFAGQTGDPTCPVSPGQQGIYCNFVGAGSGGGIYATNAAAVNLIGNSTRPALLQNNSSPNDGGGIYATGAGTTVDLSDTWVKNNGAYLRGGGVFIGAGATLNVTSEVSSCGGRIPCSRFESNNASSPVANPGQGGALAVVGGGDANLFQTTFTANTSDLRGSVVFLDGAGSTMLCEGCVVHHNLTVTNESFFETDHSALLRVAFSTIDEQTADTSAIFDVSNSSTVEIFSSILLATHPTWGGQIFEDPSGAGGTRVADCIVFQETTPSLPPPLDPGSQEAVLDASTLFAQRAVYDYHLRHGSQAQDFCDTYRYTPQRADMDLQSRGFDDSGVPNNPFGAWDLGADEWRPLLSDGFETGNCSRWPARQGGC